ncbi:MAG TPA: hypothetical protein ENN17_03550 [bacterium]|nr:hypothetical protein [bacterium]
MIVISEAVINRTIEDLAQKHGSEPDIKDRIEIGVRQTASLWQKSDGSEEAFNRYCLDHFIADPEKLGRTRERFEKNLESIDGHFLEITRDLMEPMDLDLGPMLPVDYQFAEYSPWTHLSDDLFRTGTAFSALLNFRLYPLEERLKLGPAWTREDWARARLAERFSARVPAEVRQSLNTAYVRAEDYIANYNIWMHHVLTWDGRRIFPENLKLISHWGLRDELRGRYADPGGEERQELIRLIMEKIIRQEIPQAAIDNPAVDWQLTDNSVTATTAESGREKPEKVDGGREPDTRYRHLLNVFQAERLADPWYPTLPSKIDRRFKRDREIPEETVEALFVSLLSSDEFKQTGRLVSARLGRPLKPFDIWYNGFKAAGAYPEAELDRIVSRKYPDIRSFQDDIPDMLRKLGFDRKTADFIGSKIVVDPARGAGHAMGAQRRADNAHLRTRVPPGGMDYKGYNIACHELGHNVEQVLSLNKVDHTLLAGVPNTAFTEAFAFIFQARDLELLGLKPENGKQDGLRILNRFWSACEIAGVSLVDMKVWRWMYENPKAGPEELREAVIRIAKEVWNTYFTPVFGEEDVILLAVYSHMINGGMYLPDYPLGYIIAHQIESYLKDRNLGREMERMCVLGAVTPDAWMQEAVGGPISTEPMREDVGRIIKTIK